MFIRHRRVAPVLFACALMFPAAVFFSARTLLTSKENPFREAGLQANPIAPSRIEDPSDAEKSRDDDSRRGARERVLRFHRLHRVE
jgi:hypothetical protein